MSRTIERGGDGSLLATDNNVSSSGDRAHAADDSDGQDGADLSLATLLGQMRKDDAAVRAYMDHVCGLTLQQLQEEPALLQSQLQRNADALQQLCRDNYDRFIRSMETADALRGPLLGVLSTLSERLHADALPTLSAATQSLVAIQQQLAPDRRTNRLILDQLEMLVEFLEIPQLMDTCVRNGHHDAALKLQEHVQRWSKRLPGNAVLRLLAKETYEVATRLQKELVDSLGEPGLSLPRAIRTISLLRQIASSSSSNSVSSSFSASFSSSSDSSTSSSSSSSLSSSTATDSELACLFLMRRDACLAATPDIAHFAAPQSAQGAGGPFSPTNISATSPSSSFSSASASTSTAAAASASTSSKLSSSQTVQRLRRFIDISRENLFDTVTFFRALFPVTDNRASAAIGLAAPGGAGGPNSGSSGWPLLRLPAMMMEGKGTTLALGDQSEPVSSSTKDNQSSPITAPETTLLPITTSSSSFASVAHGYATSASVHQGSASLLTSTSAFAAQSSLLDPTHPARLLEDWSMHRISNLLAIVERELPAVRDGSAIAGILSQLMYFGSSLGRVGLDFRATLPPLFEGAVRSLYSSTLSQAARQLLAAMDISLVSSKDLEGNGVQGAGVDAGAGGSGKSAASSAGAATVISPIKINTAAVSSTSHLNSGAPSAAWYLPIATDAGSAAAAAAAAAVTAGMSSHSSRSRSSASADAWLPPSISTATLASSSSSSSSSSLLATQISSPPASLMSWPCLSRFANQIVSALNDLRVCCPYGVVPAVCSETVGTLRLISEAIVLHWRGDAGDHLGREDTPVAALTINSGNGNTSKNLVKKTQSAAIQRESLQRFAEVFAGELVRWAMAALTATCGSGGFASGGEATMPSQGRFGSSSSNNNINNSFQRSLPFNSNDRSDNIAISTNVNMPDLANARRLAFPPSLLETLLDPKKVIEPLVSAGILKVNVPASSAIASAGVASSYSSSSSSSAAEADQSSVAIASVAEQNTLASADPSLVVTSEAATAASAEAGTHADETAHMEAEAITSVTSSENPL